MIDDDLVTVAVDERVATLTLNRPAARNSLNAPLVTAIIAAMDAIEADDGIGAVVVTGAGSAFCAGADLGNLADADGESLSRTYEGFLRIARSPLPTVAAVNGPAVGAGMNLALGCDVRIAGHSARFETRFLDIGLHPGGGHTWMLRRIVGQQAAMAATVFGQVLDGPEAARIGLVHRCVEDAVLAVTAQEFAARAAGAPRELAITTKRSVMDMADVPDHGAAVARELAAQLWSAGQPWFAERLAALRARVQQRHDSPDPQITPEDRS